MAVNNPTLDVRLSPNDHAELFRNAVAGPALRRTQPARAPSAFLLGGQPGSGKSTFARLFATQFGSSNFVHVDVDRLRPLHPAYLPLMADPTTELHAPTAVQRDCSAWADQLRDAAIAAHRHMLIENTMRAPDQVRDAANALRSAGYSTEARLLAVHPATSEVALLNRYEIEKRTLGFGREMPLEYHNLAARGLVDSVKILEAEQLVDHLTIVDRAGNIIYENHLQDGQWKALPRGAAAMEDCRTTSMDVAERRNVLRIWNEVLDMMERRSASAAEIEAVEERRNSTQRALAAMPRVLPPNSAIGDAHRIVEGGTPGGRMHFHGKVLEVNDQHVVQKIGRDPDMVARHDLSKLSRVPDIGEVVDVRYGGNTAQVSDRSHGQNLNR